MSVNRMKRRRIKQIYISNFTKSRLKEQCYFVTEAQNSDFDDMTFQ